MNKIRLSIFKRQIKEQELHYLKDLDDTELLKLLNTTVLPNAASVNAVKNTFFFYMAFAERANRREQMIRDLNIIANFTLNLEKVERYIIKYGAIVGFESKDWKKEFYKYLETPLLLRSAATGNGRKVLYPPKFKDIFFFAYRLVKGGEKNAKVTKF